MLSSLSHLSHFSGCSMPFFFPLVFWRKSQKKRYLCWKHFYRWFSNRTQQHNNNNCLALTPGSKGKYSNFSSQSDDSRTVEWLELRLQKRSGRLCSAHRLTALCCYECELHIISIRFCAVHNVCVCTRGTMSNTHHTQHQKKLAYDVPAKCTNCINETSWMREYNKNLYWHSLAAAAAATAATFLSLKRETKKEKRCWVEP